MLRGEIIRVVGGAGGQGLAPVPVTTGAERSGEIGRHKTPSAQARIAEVNPNSSPMHEVPLIFNSCALGCN